MNTNITISIAEAYDRISILQVKRARLKNNPNPIVFTDLTNQIEDLEHNINNSIGNSLAFKIYKSEEYLNLYQKNEAIFNMIDILNEYEKEENFLEEDWIEMGRLGKNINRMNNERFTAKNELQTRFFGAKTEEVKLGI